MLVPPSEPKRRNERCSALWSGRMLHTPASGLRRIAIRQASGFTTVGAALEIVRYS